MALHTQPASQEKSSGKKSGISRVFTLLVGIVCFGLLGYLLFQISHQFLVPPPAHRLILVQDIPLPSGLPAPAEEKLLASGTDPNALTPGVAQNFDGFDFQAYDPDLHLLFVDHTGPNPDLLLQEHVNFDPARDGPFDGHIIVFNTLSNKIVGRVKVPQVAGMVYVPGLDKVFAADAQDNYIADIDPHTLKVTATIQLQDNESPDAMVYDPVDKRLFVSDSGAPVDPLKDMNTDRNNENVAVIDAVNDKLIRYINFGNIDLIAGENIRPTDGIPLVADPKNPGKSIPKFGHDVGHDQYYNGFIYVTSQILPDGNNLNPVLLPPPGTGELLQINAVNLTIAGEIDMPVSCSTPHGFAIDAAQHTGYIACTDFAPTDSGRKLFENLARVDLSDPTTMKVIPTDPTTTRLQGGPDIVKIDHNSALNVDVLFVGCQAGISIFDITPGKFHKLGNEIIGKGTHTIAVVDLPQGIYVYLPMNIGGRPVLRIAKYNPNGQSSF
jgi:DNA-binding beta-propeller fold protein YncE